MPFCRNGRVLSIFLCLGDPLELLGQEGAAGTEMEGSAAAGGSGGWDSQHRVRTPWPRENWIVCTEWGGLGGHGELRSGGRRGELLRRGDDAGLLLRYGRRRKWLGVWAGIVGMVEGPWGQRPWLQGTAGLCEALQTAGWPVQKRSSGKNWSSRWEDPGDYGPWGQSDNARTWSQKRECRRAPAEFRSFGWSAGCRSLRSCQGSSGIETRCGSRRDSCNGVGVRVFPP